MYWYIFKDGICIERAPVSVPVDILEADGKISVASAEFLEIFDASLLDGEVKQKPPKALTLDERREQAWKRIKDIRDNKERDPVPYLGKLLDFNSLSSERLGWAIDGARTAIMTNITFLVTWTCYDNSKLTMTEQEIINIPLAVAKRSDRLHAQARDISRPAIEAAQTEEELNNIVEEYWIWANT